MINFYTAGMSTKEMLILLFFQMTPALIVYCGALKYCFPTKINWRTILLLSLSAYNLGWIFNTIIQYYFQDLLAIHNVFSIISQSLMMLILYLVFHRGERTFLIDLMLVTILATLAAGLFEYISIFLLNRVGAPLASSKIINWYFLVFLLFLPLLKNLLNWINLFLTNSLLSLLVLLWMLLLSLNYFFMFVQVCSIREVAGQTNYSSIIFLADSYIGDSLIKWLAPSATFIIEPIYHVFFKGSVLIFINMAGLTAFSMLIFINRRAKKRLEAQEQVKYELTQYINSLESVTQNIRKNHHDFSNLLFSLGGYIYQEPINEKELKKYFEDVTQTFEADYHYFLEISRLSNLENPELKTLIFTKLMAATKEDIPFDIEIDQPIKKLPIDHLALARIFGILIDNALEAAEESEKPFVRLAILEEEHHYLFVLVNATKNRTISPALMQKENFSTKGENRGLGLSIVQSIIQNYSHILTLKTTQNEQEFCQTLILKKERVYGT
ncbi:GHKL domain-containing protein [Enterococcus hulanensis]|uniref:GHKL domain-containing protein n=1 Tax=Enterococcus hulanensis TaxID=2559929 RepID=A0ABU3F0I8_9ENTE|nr:GHKL domain-containing protein [Enterococcus hulanensis]MDT2600641.1 GHKL domain-containing protein [Enterococcus hulanensis]MDT2610164.1 GHKL domain-containing protein [Enterococcus hulanensis]MDT2617428.1 GHKL domain-containing protein [Enterococcus hulanensis]MDT2628109.1 GHKL domain-containing protein [Enterococcus hulanensis]MDT2655214.1 GHKL domain-containing protein [Enterococcus hulanensis]